MPLQKIDVLVAHPDHPDDPDHGTTHRVTVLHRDRLVAEEKAPENGILKEQEGLMTPLVLWNALRRLRVHDQELHPSRDRILDTDAVPVAQEPDSLADPTQPGQPTGSPSPSAATGPESTGSTSVALTPEPTPTA